MKIAVKKLLCCSCLLLFFTHSFSQNYNLDFEKVFNSQNRGWGWMDMPGFEVKLDSKEVYSGNTSIVIASKEDKDKTLFQPISYGIPVSYPVQKIKITCYYKTEDIGDEGGALWLRADPNISFMNSLNSTYLHPSKEWAKYEMEMFIHPPFQEHVNAIVFGAFLMGKGKLWVDHFEVMINDKPLVDFNRGLMNVAPFIKRGNKEWFRYYRMAKVSLADRKYDYALTRLDESIRLAQGKDSILELMNSYDLKSDIYLLKEGPLHIFVLENLLKAYELSKLGTDRLTQLKYKTAISMFYLSSENYTKGIKTMEELIEELDVAKEQDNESYISMDKEFAIKIIEIPLALSAAYIQLHKPELARKYNQQFFDRLLEFKGTALNRSMIQEYYYNEAEICFLEKKYSKAKEMFFESEECTRYENIFRGELRKSFFLGKVAYHEGNYKKAIDVLESGLENKGEFESIENFNEDYLLYLAKSHKKLSNFEKANAYFEDHIKVLDSVVRSKDTISGKLRDEEVKQITKEFNNLETAKEILTRNILYGGTSMAVLFMVILGSVYRSRKRNQKKFQVVLAQLEQKEKLLSAQEQTVEKHKVSYDLKDDVVEQISIGLKKLEKKEYFLQSDCTQVNVAKKLKTNTAYVSKFMNAHYGYNFNTYLNNLRIDYAIDRLKNDTVFRSYTVQAISEELGYKSVNTFTKAFKNETGILPSYYIKKVSSM